jgi:hypothetical protein
MSEAAASPPAHAVRPGHRRRQAWFEVPVHSAARCFALTRDAREPVQLMIEYLRRPEKCQPGGPAGAWLVPYEIGG